MKNEEEYIGMPTEEVPRKPPGEDCNGKKVDKGPDPTEFRGYCNNPAGKGTDHLGEGRCKNHAGASLKGREHPNFKHGLFSDHLNEEERAELESIEAAGNLANLESLINYEFFRLRRAVRELEDDSDEDGDEPKSFWDAYNEIIQEASETGLGSDEIASLADLLDSRYGAFAKRVEQIRKLVKTFEELNEGRKVSIDGDFSHTHAGDADGAPISVEWKASEAEQQQSEDDTDE